MREATSIAAKPNLVEQLSAANAPFRASLRRRSEFQPFPDAAWSEPGLSGDVADRGSGLAQNMDLIKDGLPRATVRLPGQVSMRRCVASTTRTTCDRRCVFIVGFGQQGSTR